MGMMDGLGDLFEKGRQLVSGVKQGEEQRDPGPGDVGPTLQSKSSVNMGGEPPQLLALEMTPAEAKQWWKDIRLARERAKTRHEKWDILLKEYLPIITKGGEAEHVKVMQHFRNVHSKLGNLFYRAPDLLLEAEEPSPLNTVVPNPMGQDAPPLKMEDIIGVKQQVLKKKLGREGIKATRLMDELLFDVLAWAGIGACKLGYRAVFRPQSEPPEPQPGAILGLSPAPAPIQVPVFEEWYCRRFSPKRVLWNVDLRSTRFDEDATWMGMEFFMSPKRAKAAFNLTDEDVAKSSEEALTYKHEGDENAGGSGMIRGVEIWLKGEYFVEGEVHPQAIYQLVFIDGIEDRPVVYRPSPDQTFDPITGRISQDSLLGFPIKVLTIRDLAESPFVPSDSAFTNSEIKQLTTFIRQSLMLRDSVIGKSLVDTNKLTPEGREVLESGEVGAYISVESEALANGADKIVAPVPQPTRTNDDYRTQQMIQSNIDMTLGISATGAGAELSTVRSATEVSSMMTSMQGRNDKELHRVLEFYLEIARAIDSLLMRYADENEYVMIVGQDGTKRLQMWNKQLISGRYLYDFAPDSAVKIDTERDFDMDAKYWNLAAKSPLTNQEYVLRRMARRRGMDPDKAVKPAASMEGPKEPPVKMSLTMSGEDLANPLVVALLVKSGIITPEEAALNAPPPPPEGAADKADVVSKHEASNSGRMPNEPGSRDFRSRQPGD